MWQCREIRGCRVVGFRAYPQTNAEPSQGDPWRIQQAGLGFRGSLCNLRVVL